MILGIAERYTIAQGPEGITVTMRQGGRGLSFAAVSAAALFVSMWFGPYGPRPMPGFDGAFYWAWSAGLALFVILGLLGSLYRERWIISEQEICVTASLGSKPRRLPRGSVVPMRLEVRDPLKQRGKTGTVFPYTLHVLDVDGRETALRLEFSTKPGLDQFLKALRPVLSITVEEPPVR